MPKIITNKGIALLIKVPVQPKMEAILEVVNSKIGGILFLRH